MRAQRLLLVTTSAVIIIIIIVVFKCSACGECESESPRARESFEEKSSARDHAGQRESLRDIPCVPDIPRERATCSEGARRLRSILRPTSYYFTGETCPSYAPCVARLSVEKKKKKHLTETVAAR